MMKHILLVKLKDNSPQHCQKVKELFLSMKKEVPVIRDLAVGIDFLHSERSYDVVLEVLLDSPQALEQYQIHPYHAEVVKPYIWEVRQSSVVVDYHIEESR